MYKFIYYIGTCYDNNNLNIMTWILNFEFE